MRHGRDAVRMDRHGMLDPCRPIMPQSEGLCGIGMVKSEDDRTVRNLGECQWVVLKIEGRQLIFRLQIRVSTSIPTMLWTAERHSYIWPSGVGNTPISDSKFSYTLGGFDIYLLFTVFIYSGEDAVFCCDENCWLR